MGKDMDRQFREEKMTNITKLISIQGNANENNSEMH